MTLETGIFLQSPACCPAKEKKKKKKSISIIEERGITKEGGKKMKR